MGYTGNVIDLDKSDIIDLEMDIKRAVGRKIKINFLPESRKDEKTYMLHDAKVGVGVTGAYIHFFLKENEDIIEFIINGIKYFEYDVFQSFRKYAVSVSEELLISFLQKDNTSTPAQYGDKTYVFNLYIEQ